MKEIHSLSFEAYQAAAGINASNLKRISPPNTPAHFKAYIEQPQQEPTSAQKIGVITHRAILEPDTMDGSFHVRPEGMDGRTKDGRAWLEAHNDKPIITASESTSITAMRDAVWKHKTARALLKGGKLEQCLFATDDKGTLRKARLDALTGGNIIPDLKTCEDASAEGFSKSIWNYFYYYSAAFYLDLCQLLGIDKQAFVFICVEKHPPYAVAVHNLLPELIEYGRIRYRRDLALYRHCMETGKWPGYPESITDIGVPAYAQKEVEATLNAGEAA